MFLHDVVLTIKKPTKRYHLKPFKTSPFYTRLHSKQRPSQCVTITPSQVQLWMIYIITYKVKNSGIERGLCPVNVQMLLWDGI